MLVLTYIILFCSWYVWQFHLHIAVHYKHHIPIWVYPFSTCRLGAELFAEQESIPFDQIYLDGFNNGTKMVRCNDLNNRLWDYKNVTRWELGLK